MTALYRYGRHLHQNKEIAKPQAERRGTACLTFSVALRRASNSMQSERSLLWLLLYIKHLSNDSIYCDNKNATLSFNILTLLLQMDLYHSHQSSWRILGTIKSSRTCILTFIIPTRDSKCQWSSNLSLKVYHYVDWWFTTYNIFSWGMSYGL